MQSEGRELYNHLGYYDSKTGKYFNILLPDIVSAYFYEEKSLENLFPHDGDPNEFNTKITNYFIRKRIEVLDEYNRSVPTIYTEILRTNGKLPIKLPLYFHLGIQLLNSRLKTEEREHLIKEMLGLRLDVGTCIAIARTIGVTPDKYIDLIPEDNEYRDYIERIYKEDQDIYQLGYLVQNQAVSANWTYSTSEILEEGCLSPERVIEIMEFENKSIQEIAWKIVLASKKAIKLRRPDNLNINEEINKGHKVNIGELALFIGGIIEDQNRLSINEYTNEVDRDDDIPIELKHLEEIFK